MSEQQTTSKLLIDPIFDEGNVYWTYNDIFRYLESVSNVAALDPYERDIYEACLMRARDYNATMKSARMTAMAEGRAEGRAEGIMEGIEKEKYATARRLFEIGMDAEAIAMATMLPLDVIKSNLWNKI